MSRVIVALLLWFGVPLSESARWRIQRGQPAPLGQFPFVSYVTSTSHNSNRQFSCSGSIIGEDTILTAAHCVCDANRLNSYATVGTIQVIQGNIMPPSAKVYKIFDVYLHPEWQRANIAQRKIDCSNTLHPLDFAILKTCDKIEFNKFVQPITLLNKKIDTGQRITLLGFGLTENNDSSGILRFGENVIADLPGCLPAVLCSSNVGAPGMNFIDSGGPCVIKRGNQYLQIGVNSLFNYKFLTLYAEIVRICDWIDTVCRSQIGFDPGSPACSIL